MLGRGVCERGEGGVYDVIGMVGGTGTTRIWAHVGRIMRRFASVLFWDCFGPVLESFQACFSVWIESTGNSQTLKRYMAVQ